MQLIRHFGDIEGVSRPRVLAIGVFDGMHRGHQAVLARLRNRADELGGETWVALQAAAPIPALTSLRRRVQLLDAYGIARTLIIRADDLSEGDIAAKVAAVVWVAGRSGTAPSGCSVDLVAPVTVDGIQVGTDRLRAGLQNGDLPSARRGLGYDPTVVGRIVHGFHRGTSIGVPTANLRLRDLVLPPDGVYAVRARLAGATLQGVANIGFNPTFGNRTRSVETHLLDFCGDVYGKSLEIAFVGRLRGERKFSGIDALLTQIRADIVIAREVLTAESG